MIRTILLSAMLLSSFIYLTKNSLSRDFDNSDIEARKFVCTPCNSDCDLLEYSTGGLCKHCKMPLIPINEVDQPKKIAFYLQDGVEVLDFAGPMEVFAYAGFEVFTVSKTREPITSQGILKIIPDYRIEDAPPADVLAFFGGNASEASSDHNVIDWVQSQTEVDYYFSVCTGAFILGESGLLKDKTATTFHNALDDLEDKYRHTKVVKNARYVDNGNVITTAGISAGIDGALHMVAKLKGFKTARKTAYHMEYDKWIPGEGLILSEDNPYLDLPQVIELEKYVGTYTNSKRGSLEIGIDEFQKNLFAILDGRTYPLFYDDVDSISTLAGDNLIFHQNSKKAIEGFHSNARADEYFKKIN